VTVDALAVVLAQDTGFDAVQILFLIVFFAIPLIGRVIQALRKGQTPRSGSPGAPSPRTPRERVEELEREGEEAWKRLFEEAAEADEPEPEPARPVPAAPGTRVEAPPPRRPSYEEALPPRRASLEELGRGLEAEVREISLEREGSAEGVARQTLVPELGSVGTEDTAFGSFEDLGRPIGAGDVSTAAELVVPELAAPEARRRPRIAALLASSGWSWRSAVLAAEILGPPLASRRQGGALGEPSAAFARAVPARLPRGVRRRGAG
jgi:hypothetical protein